METTGIIFAIERCAFHDGPGIRTVVFLKGCPLRCLWCCNPESQSFAPQEARYPNGTRRVIGYTASVREIIEIVLQDEAYYRTSGGGLTLSGGEAFAQPDFMLALLRAAKLHDIHTCVETCGLVSRRHLAEALPLIDLFLFDYKLSGTDAHRQYTGAGNEEILANLYYILSRGGKVRLRCPIIPGVNDTDGHFAAIARLARRYPDIQAVELMPYHNLGRGKAVAIGMDDKADIPVPDKKTEESWRRRLAFWRENLKF